MGQFKPTLGQIRFENDLGSELGARTDFGSIFDQFWEDLQMIFERFWDDVWLIFDRFGGRCLIDVRLIFTRFWALAFGL